MTRKRSETNAAESPVLVMSYKCLRAILALCAGLLFSVSVFGQATHRQQEITVRLLDFKSGKPIIKLDLSITGFNGRWSRGKATDRSIVFRASKKTDNEGRVTVSLAEPFPEHIRIFSFDLVEALPDFAPADVLKSGAVVPYSKSKEDSKLQKLQVSAQPGEIIILNKKVTAWDNMRREIP